MAFQPIVDLGNRSLWGYEALVRGTAGESAAEILDQVTAENRYRFDQACRVRAIELAAASGAAGSQARLSINFMPNAVYEPAACIRATLTTAAKVGFDPKRIVFEFTENEPLDVAHVGHIVTEYKRMGFRTALDDFGAGYASLNLLAQFQPDIIKIDMELIRDVNSSASRQAIIGGIMAMTQALEITVIAEGVETYEEVQALRAMGIQIFQGFYFGRPAVEALPAVSAFHGLT